ncbi:hypothetical protein [Streptomyces sp. NPDC093600]|uniref:hypothetical protein n=1 Tax=Streptomyces sp. NPDC093600 TaxID=3366047 RepID=UPI0037F823A4
MPLNDGHGHEGHEGFEDRLGEALRLTGEGFAAHDGRGLASAGLSRGRRRLARRRAAAVTGGVLALAVIGVGGSYGGDLLGSGGGEVRGATVGAPRTDGVSARSEAPPQKEGPAQAEIPVKALAEVVEANTPAGTWTFDGLDGTGQSVAGVYDDGKGKAAVSVGLYRTGGTEESGTDQVTCPDKVYVPYDDCATERLPDGSRLMVLQGYEYPDKREETKNWRAVLLTEDGFLVDASEWNAAAQKGAPVSRETPPFSPAQLKALVTTDEWHPLLQQLPKNKRGETDPGAPTTPPAPAEPSKAAVQATLKALLPKDLKVVERGGDTGFGYVVVDDGQGRSLVQINVQSRMNDVADELFGSGDVTTLPDGRRVKLTQQPGEKGGAGVVWWTADTITADGFRVVVSAFNTGAQHEAATRAEPALTMEQLKEIALSPKWRKGASAK